MTTLTSESIADSERTAATAPQTPGRLQSAWGRCFAAIYEPLMQATENGGNATRRAAVLARARGTVVELGAGTGLNLPHYPPDVELVLTEPESPMALRLLERLQKSERQAAGAGRTDSAARRQRRHRRLHARAVHRARPRRDAH